MDHQTHEFENGHHVRGVLEYPNGSLKSDAEAMSKLDPPHSISHHDWTAPLL
jgi:hypothetical protein